MPEQERMLGATLAPDTTTPSLEPHLGAGELPEQLIVPAWRDCFDADFKPIPAKIRARILDQGQQPSCVGHGTSVQKSAQEGELISPRDIFRLAKKYDGDPTGWGTSLGAAQDALVNDGAAADGLVDRNPNVPQDQYRSEADVTAAVLESRKQHKGRAPFQFPRTAFRQTMLQYAIPVVTSTMWYQQDNALTGEAIMRLPASAAIAGHCVAIIGWIRTSAGIALVMVNSFGPGWGANGLFFVPLDGTENRFNNGYVTLDIPTDVAAIVAKYEGKDVQVQGAPELYRIEGGKARHYPDEIVWWAHGRLFGIDVFDISAGDLSALPAGSDVTIEEAPFKGRELVRQIRQHYGHA